MAVLSKSAARARMVNIDRQIKQNKANLSSAEGHDRTKYEHRIEQLEEAKAQYQPKVEEESDGVRSQIQPGQ